ncbi:MAG: hypothetical protein KDD35_01700 [Bdellovibrionales bacterium]|nr:hypothetical protein [Bdellovibrionales bacterium]
MGTGLIIIHQEKPAPVWQAPHTSFEVWSTCLRHIAIAHPSELSGCWERRLEPGGQVFRDEEAYEFLLEILSGLHSPLVAETEVFGQFKAFLDETLAKRKGIWPVQGLLLNLVKDVKSIRQSCLIGLCGQSYGSLTRKHLAPYSQLGVLGSGRLVKDILPWFAKKEIDLRLFCRSVEKAHELGAGFPSLKLESIREGGPFGTQALVVAAPIAGNWFRDWSKHRFPHLELILDLRGEGENDPLQTSVPVVCLRQFFSLLEENRKQTQNAVADARSHIQLIVKQLRESVRNRPFGWDDLCA